jgi:hypothetical protein
LRTPSLPTLLAVDPWNPPPPPAAPAAGGWGFHGSRPVYSVGVGLVPAGGVAEAGRLSAWSLVSAGSPSGDGAPRSFLVKRLTSSSLEVLGSGELGVPRPGSTWRRFRWLNKKRKMVSGYSASSATSSAVGSSDSAFGDFPLALGLALIQGVLRSSGSGAPPARLVLRRGRGPEEVDRGLLCIFKIFLDLSVRTRF